MLKFLRKTRQRLWQWQIVLGDAIALLNRRLISRLVRKELLKRTGRAVKRATWRRD